MEYMLTYEEQEQKIHELKKEAADQDRVQEALVRSREDWEDTFDAMADIFMVLDDEHRIIRANSAAAEALNTTKESLVGKKCYEIIHGHDYPVEECPLLLSKKTLKPHSEEISIPAMGGTFICSTSLIVDGEGRLKGYSQVLRDVTESKRLERQLQHDQKLEAISSLSGIIAHEFNNLLMGIQGNAVNGDSRQCISYDG
jgi:PAS domain S-box-containing protein